MEFEQLQGFILLLVLLGMILGVGVLILDKFGIAVKDSTTITNEAVTITSGAGQLANDDVTSMSFFGNETINSSFTGIDFDEEINWTTAGVIAVNGTFTDGAYNASYVYDADSTSTTTLAATTTAVAAISTTWLGLIVTIAILAIILTLVIRSFGGQKR